MTRHQTLWQNELTARAFSSYHNGQNTTVSTLFGVIWTVIPTVSTWTMCFWLVKFQKNHNDLTLWWHYGMSQS